MSLCPKWIFWLSPQSFGFISSLIPDSLPILTNGNIHGGTKIRNLEIITGSSLLLISCLQLNPSSDSTFKYITIPLTPLHVYYPGSTMKWVEIEGQCGAAWGFLNPRFVTLEERDSFCLPALTYKIPRKKWPALVILTREVRYWNFFKPCVCVKAVSRDPR